MEKKELDDYQLAYILNLLESVQDTLPYTPAEIQEDRIDATMTDSCILTINQMLYGK